MQLMMAITIIVNPISNETMQKPPLSLQALDTSNLHNKAKKVRAYDSHVHQV